MKRKSQKLILIGQVVTMMMGLGVIASMILIWLDIIPTSKTTFFVLGFISALFVIFSVVLMSQIHRLLELDELD